MPIQKIIHSQKILKELNNLTVFIMTNYHKIIIKQHNYCKDIQFIKKFTRKSGEQQNISEILGFLRTF